MVKIKPKDAASKWNRRLKGATEDIRTGVDGVDTAPGEQAATKEDKMRAGIVEAIDSGRWAAAVSAVSLSDWKKLMKEKGISRIASGADGAQGDVSAFFSELFPHIESAQSEVEGMPDLTLDDNISRMESFIRSMAEFTYKG